jgi:filamentous hemagglutinin
LGQPVINGVKIDVIKKENQVTSGYPVGGKPTPGFIPVN